MDENHQDIMDALRVIKKVMRAHSKNKDDPHLIKLTNGYKAILKRQQEVYMGIIEEQREIIRNFPPEGSAPSKRLKSVAK